jgi:hypothetical protein
MNSLLCLKLNDSTHFGCGFNYFNSFIYILNILCNNIFKSPPPIECGIDCSVLYSQSQFKFSRYCSFFSNVCRIVFKFRFEGVWLFGLNKRSLAPTERGLWLNCYPPMNWWVNHIFFLTEKCARGVSHLQKYLLK